ncbi:hypothetical protein GYMLUDRAFT_62657 [Collybiopsis luxurians FD-317 M1]|uniref:Uncharacterized protein n=1 Tax=Collybiopsis luxurians FD-317 M1 TaxID=944289 RepID=A0A0D0BKE7_9AGAR|nr:hypothetical protein GYMLUDRAFT_62657 [Collybiopsis luxurians FD-317 M1]
MVYQGNQELAHGSMEGTILYCFMNRRVLIRVFGATHGIVNAVFEQNLSKYTFHQQIADTLFNNAVALVYHLISAMDAWSMFPASTFDDEGPSVDIAAKTFSFITGGCRGQLTLDVSHLECLLGKEFAPGPHQFGDSTMWRIRLKPFDSEVNLSNSLLTLHGWSVVHFPSWVQVIYRLTDCGYLYQKHSMPQFVDIIVESYEQIAEQ